MAKDRINNILVSFCNERFVPELTLGLLDPEGGEFKWVETAIADKVDGACGLARKDGLVYVAFQSFRPGPRLMVYEEETLTPLFEYTLQHASDVHSIEFLDDNTLLVVSTGSDEIFALELDSSGAVTSERLWWRFPGTHSDLADQTHCNSLAIVGDEVLVTWCKSRGVGTWLPSHSGGILRIRDGALLATGITSPHSLLVDGDDMFVSANPGYVIRVNDMAMAAIGGFARGLAKIQNKLYAGSSAERVLSRSSEKKAGLSWADFKKSGARVTVLDTKTLRKLKEIDLKGLAMEIYDLLPVSSTFASKGVIPDDPLRYRAQMLTYKMFQRSSL